MLEIASIVAAKCERGQRRRWERLRKNDAARGQGDGEGLGVVSKGCSHMSVSLSSFVIIKFLECI